MPEQSLELLIRLRDEASAQLRQVNAEVKTNAATWHDSFSAIQGQLRSASVALTGFGAVLTGAFALAYHASEEQRLAHAQLANQLKNVGVAFEDVKSSIDGYTTATARSTGYSSGEQTAALSKLILITGSYTESMKYLPLVLDLSAAAHMETTEAARLLGRVMEGDVNILHRYLGAMDGATTSAQALDWMQKNLKGSAEQANTPWKQLQVTMNELSETIGTLIAGPVGKFLTKVSDIIKAIKDWADAHPELSKAIVDLGVAVGVAATAVGTAGLAVLGFALALTFIGGPITLILLGIAALVAYGVWLALEWDDLNTACKVLAVTLGVLLLALVATFSPIAAIIVGVVLLVAAGIWLASNWDKVSSWWSGMWQSMRDAPIIGPIITAIDWLIAGGEELQKHWRPWNSFWENMWEETRLVFKWIVNALLTGAEFLANMFLVPINAMVNSVLSAVEKLVNGVRKGLAFLKGERWDDISLPRIDIVAGSGWSIPRLTDEALGIGNPKPNPLAHGSSFSGVSEVYGPPAPLPLPSLFGNYGALGQTGIINGQPITINVAGSVLTSEDLANLIRQELIKIQNRNATTGIQ